MHALQRCVKFWKEWQGNNTLGIGIKISNVTAIVRYPPKVRCKESFVLCFLLRVTLSDGFHGLSLVLYRRRCVNAPLKVARINTDVDTVSDTLPATPRTSEASGVASPRRGLASLREVELWNVRDKDLLEHVAQQIASMDSFSSEEVDFEMPVDNGDKGLKDLCDNAFDGEKPVDNGDEGFKGLCENAFDGEMPVDNGDEGFKDLCDDAFDGEGLFAH